MIYRIIKFLIMLIIFGQCLSLIFAQNWHSLRNNSEGRASIEYKGVRELNEWHYSYKKNRRYELGLAVWASPAACVIGGHPMAFIGGYDQTMHALDLSQKKVLWRKITNGEITNAPVISKVNDRDIVFFGSSDRTLYAIDAFNGQKLWTKELIAPSTTLSKANLSSPFIANNKIYISCFAYDKALSRSKQKGILFCLDIKTGNVLWEITITNGFLTSPVGFKFQNKQYITIAAKRGIIQCFDITENTPKKIWDFQMPHEVLASPVISTKTALPMIFLGSKYGNVIAINALNGKKMWNYMTGNWIDNTCCIGELEGEQIVYVGSHDYNVYALRAKDGKVVWKKHLGGEIYSAPCFFYANQQALISVASLDNHLYILDAKTGYIVTSFFTGQPIWDKISKGDTLWGSPVAISAGNESVIIHGSYNDIVFVLPVFKKCSVTAMARSVKSLWISLFVVFFLFVGIALPILVKY
ncbi:PQQ-binding-like beta-propeller repeat protein [bacterium]